MSSLQIHIKNLPQTIQDLIGEFNVSHRTQFGKVLQELKNNGCCQTCKKVIFKYVYSLRNDDMICCSLECVDNFDQPMYNYYEDE